MFWQQLLHYKTRQTVVKTTLGVESMSHVFPKIRRCGSNASPHKNIFPTQLIVSSLEHTMCLPSNALSSAELKDTVMAAPTV